MHNILISGAGPTGLAAGLFLKKRGIDATIIESQAAISPHSKALGVNPRTLTLLQETGVTDALLQKGWKATAANIWKNGKTLVRVDLAKNGTDYPFMLVLPQSETEATIESALNSIGASVKREQVLTEFEVQDNKVIAQVNTDTIHADILLGADGAHSTVRKTLNIDFPGNSYAEPWKLYDLELDIPLEDNEVHILLVPKGFIFLLRIKNNLWRALGNIENLLELLPKGTDVGKIHWQSDFKISHRVAATLQQGPICLAGDAAHLHSPMGARGMNLGIEDAYIFAKLLAAGEIEHYGKLRHAVDQRVVKGISKFTQMPRGRVPWAAAARHALPFIAPIMLPIARKWLMGLDHEV